MPIVSNQPRPRAHGYAVRLDDMLLKLATGPRRVLEQTFERLQAGRVDTAGNSEEMVSEFGQVFARNDFTGGEGLDRAHRRDNDETDLSRYWSSAGVDIVAPRGGQPAKLRLLRAGESFISTSNFAAPVAFDGKLFLRGGTNLNQLTEISTPTATPSVALSDPHDGESISVDTAPLEPAVLGNYLYVSLGTNGVHRRAKGASTWDHWSDVRLDRLWSVKNRLIGAYKGTLYEVRELATSETLFTLGSDTAGRWDMVADVGPVILASGSTVDSGSSVLHAFAPDDTGDLVIASQAVQPERELIADLVVVYGQIFYTTVPTMEGTAPGKLWTAGLGEGNTLADIQLLKDFSAMTGAHAELLSGRKLTADGTNVYIGAVDAVTTKPRLWRLDAITLGIHHYTDFSADDPVLVAYPPHPLFAFGRLFLADATGLHRVSTSAYVSSGYLITPLADFATATAKEWVGATLRSETVADGTEIELFYSTDPAAILDHEHPSWRRIKRLTGGVDDLESPIASATGVELAGMVRLITTDDTLTPAARGFAFRGFPGGSDMLLELPVDVSDLLERPGKSSVRAKGRGHRLYRTLLARQGDDAVLELLDLDITLRGMVQSVSTPIATRSTRGSQVFHTMISFRGRLLDNAGAAVSSGVLGTATLGMPPTMGTTS